MSWKRSCQTISAIARESCGPVRDAASWLQRSLLANRCAGRAPGVVRLRLGHQPIVTTAVAILPLPFRWPLRPCRAGYTAARVGSDPQSEAKMNKVKFAGVMEQVKGIANVAVGKLTGNKDRELRGQVDITNGSNKKDRADWQDNVKKGADDPDNPSDE
jgi:uncharacterized protein YjbJ (UPF0337 family)